jgi:hypothetical protein
MVNEHLERSAVLYGIREMQMKTMMGLQHTWITMPKSRRLTPPNAGRLQSNVNHHSLLTGVQMIGPLQKTIWQFFTKLNVLLPYNPPITLLAIFPHLVENLCPCRNPHMDVHRSCIYNHQNLEAESGMVALERLR